MVNLKKDAKVYDAVIVGSGAGGGTAAYVLTQAGANCLMLEAGDWYDTATQSKWGSWFYDAPHRAQVPPNTIFDAYMAAVGGWTVPGEPYTNAPGTDFRWFRSRMLGGRTNSWGRISLRFGPYDFKPYSRDGKGFDWPIGYEDVAPYYDKVEELMGVFGSIENIENLPNGKFLPPPKPRCYELVVQQACKKLGIPCIPSRLAILTQPHHGRLPCHYVSQCGRGCAMSSNFSTPTVMLPPALATKKLEIRCGAMVREVLVGADGLATGVSYIDKKTRQEVQVRGKVIVLAASACETARLLLNSRSSRHPDGLANSSGVVGRYLMDNVGTHVDGFLPAMVDLPPHDCDGVGGMHLYMPWWGYQQQFRHELPFSRGYHIEFGGGRRMPAVNTFQHSERIMGGGYGSDFKRAARKHYGGHMFLACRGEMIPNDDCYCEIDRDVVDEWGIPVLKFHWKWGEEELQMAKHSQETFRQIIETAGGRVTRWAGADQDWGISRGGAIIHEVGTTRMGNDRSTSVVNQHCQTWDCKNLFIADGGPMVSNPCKNVTLTLMAVAWRTSDYIADQVRKRNV